MRGRLLEWGCLLGLIEGRFGRGVLNRITAVPSLTICLFVTCLPSSDVLLNKCSVSQNAQSSILTVTGFYLFGLRRLVLNRADRQI